jgi:hypothetical protein
VNKSRTFARRVYEFLLKYPVLHPYQPYTLQFDRGDVKGENALVVWRKYRKGDIPMLVDPLLRRPRYVKTPNYEVLAQWLAARQDADAVELGITHLPLLSGEPWLTKDVNERLARQWLNHLVSEAADKRDFPVPDRNAPVAPVLATRYSRDQRERIGITRSERAN